MLYVKLVLYEGMVPTVPMVELGYAGIDKAADVVVVSIIDDAEEDSEAEVSTGEVSLLVAELDTLPEEDAVVLEHDEP